MKHALKIIISYFPGATRFPYYISISYVLIVPVNIYGGKVITAMLLQIIFRVPLSGLL